MPKVREYERKCQNCGFNWFIQPAEIKAMKNANRLTGLGIAQNVVRGRKGFQVNEMNAIRRNRERLRNYEKCAKCGSSSYLEREIV